MSTNDELDLETRIVQLLHQVEAFVESAEKNEHRSSIPKQVFYDLATEVSNRISYNKQFYEIKDMYSRILSTMFQHCKQWELNDKETPAFAETFVRIFKRFNTVLEYLNHIFQYMDIFLPSSSRFPLHFVGMKQFKTECYDPLKERIVHEIVFMIESDRYANIRKYDESIRTGIQMITHLDTIPPVVTKPMLTDFRKLFTIQWLRSLQKDILHHLPLWKESGDTMVFVDACTQYQEEGKLRLEKYGLHHDSVTRMMTIIRGVALKENMKELLDHETTGCASLFEKQDWTSLRKVLSLFARVAQGPELISVYYYKFLLQRCLSMAEEVIQTPGEESVKKDIGRAFMMQLIDLYNQQQEVLKTSFDGHLVFLNTLRSCFTELLNERIKSDRSVEVMSIFADGLLKGEEKMEETLLEKRIESVVSLISFVRDKDVFMESCRSLMSKRLLSKKSASDELEKVFVSCMKREYGNSYTMKLEGMLNDIQLGQDMSTQFDVHYKNQQKEMKKLEFHPIYLTSSNWPTFLTLADMRIPLEVKATMDSFEHFHHNMYASRKLSWIHSLGTAVVRFRPKGALAGGSTKSYDIQVSPVQASVMMMFNVSKQGCEGDADSWSVLDVGRTCRLTEDVVKKVLFSLSSAKYKVLIKKESTEEKKESYAVNTVFTNPTLKFSIPMPLLENSGKSLKKTVEEDRSFSIDAAIVRIMKARKCLLHNELVAEVLHQLCFFRPEVKFIKKRVESLIEREYLERDPDQSMMYKYVA